MTTIQSVEKINSQEELVTKLGVAVTAPVANGSINLGFNFNKKKNHILARLIQKHFTVSTDAPKKGLSLSLSTKMPSTVISQSTSPALTTVVSSIFQ